MKNKFYTLIVLIVSTSMAQSHQGMFSKDPLLNNANWEKQRTSYGFFLGFNNYDFQFDYKVPGKDIQVRTNTNFNVGLVGDLRLSEYFNLRFEPALNYTQRDLGFPGFTQNKDFLREVKSTYLHFPLLIKYSAMRTGNIRPFLMAGYAQSLNLASNSSVTDDNAQQVFRMKRTNSYAEIGFGIDLYFEYFKFTPTIRGVFGLEDELIRDNDPNSPWTSNIASMKTQGVFVNLIFQ